MNAPRAIIAEDEPLLGQSLKAALARAWPELVVLAIAPNGIEALKLIERDQPDIAFLDIRMPGLTGLEVAAELADRLDADAQLPALVFVTAYDEFALKAFDLAATDYLIKPVNPQRLQRTVERLKAQLAAPPVEDVTQLAARLGSLIAAASGAPTVSPPVEPLTVIRAAVGNTVRMVPVAEVLYFQATDKYTLVVTLDAERLIRTSLKDLLLQLPAAQFRQIHRSTIVNLQAVTSAVRDEAGRMSLTLRGRKETLAVSRVFADLFRQM
jgi:DNA-binding LytR/AlgR family response regulator